MNRPSVEVRDGVLHFVFHTGELEHAYPLTVEGATEFAAELAGKLQELKGDPELMKKIGTKAVHALVDLFTKGKT
jgi:hypothetical protein